MLGAGVVRGDVEDETDVPVTRRASQRRERGVAAEMVGDPAVVDRVVPVVRAGVEDRVQVDGVDAEVDEVVEMRLEPERSPPKNSTSADASRRGGSSHAGMARGMAAVRPGAVLHVVRRVAVGEPIGEDLVEDPVGEPGRRVEPGHQPEVVVVGRRRPMQSGAIEPPVPVGRHDQESVADRRHRQADSRLPPPAGGPRRDLG